jgi:hypothetical protein
MGNKLRIPLPFDKTMEAVLKVKPEPKRAKQRPKKRAVRREAPGK